MSSSIKENHSGALHSKKSSSVTEEHSGALHTDLVCIIGL